MSVITAFSQSALSLFLAVYIELFLYIQNVLDQERDKKARVFYASDTFLAQPQNTQQFEPLKAQQRVGTTHRHEALFDSILGCLGYRLSDGGINASNNWCAFSRQQRAERALLSKRD